MRHILAILTLLALIPIAQATTVTHVPACVTYDVHETPTPRDAAALDARVGWYGTMRANASIEAWGATVEQRCRLPLVRHQ